MNQSVGKLLILGGVILVGLGIIWYFFGDKLGWIGNLPGDIKVEKENSGFYFPITTMILLSVIFSLVMALVRRFF